MKYKYLVILALFSVAFQSCSDKQNRDESDLNRLKKDTSQKLITSNIQAGGDKEPEKNETQRSTLVTSENVTSYTGKHVTLKGIVSQIVQKNNITYINIDKKFPKNKFFAVIFSDKQHLFRKIDELEGKTVEIEGTVSIYKGKYEIILNDPAMIRVSNESP
ncbi:hypothetical protein BH10BAC5_BH10BAC5_09180 [soil metagenome]